LLPCLGVPRRLQTMTRATPRREQIVQPLRLRAFLEGDVHRASHPGEELQQRRILSGQDAAGDDLAAGLPHRRERC
jgi:hypothetical protein